VSMHQNHQFALRTGHLVVRVSVCPNSGVSPPQARRAELAVTSVRLGRTLVGRVVDRRRRCPGSETVECQRPLGLISMTGVRRVTPGLSAVGVASTYLR